MKEVLDEEIIYQQPGFKRVKQYVLGWYPNLGKLHFGISGKETIIERDRIKAMKVFEVKHDRTGNSLNRQESTILSDTPNKPL